MLGALGAFLFNVSLMPYFLASTYFENFQFVKDLKEGKITVNKTEQVYIQENTSLQNAIEKAKHSVVSVQGTANASGLIVTSDGLVATLASITKPNGNVNVFLNGEAMDFTVTKTDTKNNLALLKLSKNNLQTVGFVDSNKVKLGQRVFVIGQIAATENTGETNQNNWFTNEGIITEITNGIIKTNIVERPVVAGGPLFNSAGELVGLNVVDKNGKVSAISVDKIQALLGL